MALARGDLLLSFRYHPLTMPALVCTGACLVALAWGGAAPGSKPFADRLRSVVTSRRGAIASTGLILGVWVLRGGLQAAGVRFFLW